MIAINLDQHEIQLIKAALERYHKDMSYIPHYNELMRKLVNETDIVVGCNEAAKITTTRWGF